jgi:hypothetical protein
MNMEKPFLYFYLFQENYKPFRITNLELIELFIMLMLIIPMGYFNLEAILRNRK